ncbi:LLM class flavin-dependent oxidoreductase [Flavitalea sp. BT771]|uniref:MupA/Atu3671 family FMN-dependent luciferase-like monooxygenase n=1 Tax=Flavitalea sp. BT771 TaxID=3063329 RepID=UPI0026E44F72|nr:MupA/Atu3671 family FMN-dependent luciferase-like monooxygenase [Flavitalea sp. BT771]MDO6434617.1 LLM class flavin-dependent oxidoreductase [Flavitalea sp. BT771]MDV6223517.1 LLM class flavin-dependent oxidoreductase [Flavitalea sp. BT771]
MNLFVKGDQSIALVTNDSVLSVRRLLDSTKAFQDHLRGKVPALPEKVILYLSDETLLLPALLGLYGLGVTCVPLDPGASPAADPEAVALLCQADWIITEPKYSFELGTSSVLVMDRTTLSGHSGQPALTCEKHFIPYVFYNEEDGYSQGIPIHDEDLSERLKELDQSLCPHDHDRLLLARCIPFRDLVMEMLWSFSRAIPVLVTWLDKNTALPRLASTADRFDMRFSLFYFGSVGDATGRNMYDLLFDTVRYADNNGFDAVWTPERHFNGFGGLFPNPSVMSAALAVATSHVELRCGSIVAPLHHPIRIAEDWSVIDNLSNGRAAISFATGWQPDDFVFSPDHYEGRHEYMLEQIELVRRLWRGESAQFKNGMGIMTELSIYPRPVQKELPVWITVSGKVDSFLAAGRVGANILTHLLWQDLEELKEKIARYRTCLEQHGFDPSSRKVCVMVHTYLGTSDEAVRAKVKQPLKDYFRTSTQLIRAMIKPGELSTVSANDDEMPAHLMEELLEIAFNRFYEHAALLGNPDKCRSVIRRIKNCGIDEIAALIDFGLSREDIMQGLELLNDLRKEYNGGNDWQFPVTITHCSQQTLEDLRTEAAFPAFFATQRIVFTEENKGAYTPFFNAPVSQEF